MSKKKDSKVQNMNETVTKNHGSFYYALPWNLRKEIALYGYSFSAKHIAFIYAVVILLGVFLGKLFKLPGILWYIPLILSGMLFSPKIVRNSYKNKYEFARFSDVNTYVEQMLYAFKNSQKILTALGDVRILFPEGSPMRSVIDEAYTMIQEPDTECAGDIEKCALRIIEKRYPNQHIKDIHNFMLKVENIGGDFDSSIDLLLNSRAMWENRMLKLRDKRKSKRQQILVSCIASIALCMVMLYILPQQVDIAENPIACVANVLLIISCFAIFVKADSKLATNLISPRKPEKESAIIDSYHRYLNWDAKKEMMKSIIYSILPFIVMVLGLIFHNKVASGVGLAFVIIMLSQHILGHHLLEKRLRREINHAFPQWLMELALLLQSDNVQVSIFKTIPNAAAIMRPELERFQKAIRLHPDSSEPFMNFFHEFQMPEITTSMQMLYSLSVGSGGDADEQISNIVKRNNIILDRAEEQANDDTLASLTVLFMLPVLCGGAVMMADMTIFLLAFINTMMV